VLAEKPVNVVTKDIVADAMSIQIKKKKKHTNNSCPSLDTIWVIYNGTFEKSTAPQLVVRLPCGLW
jgi:hypothetical protein